MGKSPSPRRPSRERIVARPLFIKVRVSKEEKTHFESLASHSGVSLSDFIRKRLARVRIYPAHIALERNRQLARIGNNMNQVARWANTYKSALEAVRVLSVLVGLRREVKAFITASPEEEGHAD